LWERRLRPNEMLEPDGRSRRDLLKAAVAIGGSAGLSACLGWLGEESEPVPTGDGTTHERQFTWNDRVPEDDHGNTQLPPTYTVFGTIDDTGLATLDKIAARGVRGSGDDGAPAAPVTITSARLD